MIQNIKKIGFSLLAGLLFLVSIKVQAATVTWDFSDVTDYSYVATYIDVLSGAALKLVDQLDSDNTSTGFAGGTHSDTEWVTASSSVQLTTTGKTNGVGTFTSRIFDAGTSTSWTTFVPVPVAPYGKPLPDNEAVETGYATSSVNMSNNLALYHFDEASGNFSDSSGNGMTGTASGTMTYSQNSIFNSGVRFNGTDNAVVVPNFDSTANLSTFSMEGWFKFSSVAASDVLISQYNSGTNQRFSWQTHTTADELIFYVSATPSASPMGWFTSGADLAANTWYHLTLVWNGNASTEAGKVVMYVNGVKPAVSKVGATVITQFTGTTGLPLTLGSMQNFHPREYPGFMDEVALYDRALTDAEVVARYKRGALNIQYQVASCDDAVCSGESLAGPAGSTSAYYSELLNTTTGVPSFSLSGVNNNRYFKYSARLTATSTTYNAGVTPELSQVSISPDHYYGAEPTIHASSTSIAPYGGALSAFSVTEGGTGSIQYQITNNGDSTSPTWYYWNNSNWVVASQSTHYNSSSTVNTRIGQFSTDVGMGNFAWRAFMRSPNTTETATLSSVQLTYAGPTLTASDAPLNSRAANLIIGADYFDAGSYKSIPDWRVGGDSIALLNLPFEAHTNSATVAQDYSESNFDGTVNNGATFSNSTGRDGYGAYTFDGTNDYISVPHAASLALTDDFTVTGWVKRSTGSTDWDGFISKSTYSASATTGWGITYDGLSARYAAFVGCNGSVDIINSNTGTASSTDYGWHHVALKVTSGTTYFYIDGVRQAHYSTQPICDSGGAVTIGRYYSNLAAHYFKGVVDEVVIWDRSLSDAQITAFSSQQRDRIVAGETSVGEVWSASVTQNNGTADVVTEATDTVTILARASTSPQISGLNLAYDNYWVKQGQTLALSINSCSDEDGDAVTYRWTVDGTTAASTQSFTMSGSSYSEGQHAVVAICTDSDGNTDQETLNIEVLDDTDFTIVNPTNLAYNSQYFPGIMNQQARWITQTQDVLDTQFAVFSGDLVIDGGSSTYWSRVSTTMAILHNSSTPFFSAIGNHDYDDNLVQDNTGSRNATFFDTYLPYTRYASEDWWGGQKDSSGVNTYQFFSVNEVEYMILNLEFCPSDTTLAWADTLVSDYPNKNIVVNIHSYLNHDGELLTTQELGCHEFFDLSIAAGTGKNNGQQVWDEFIKEHENIFMVMSAHVLGDGVDYRNDAADNDNIVHQIFHYEYGAYTGIDEHTASTVLLIFKPDQNIIQFRDYDPWFDTFETDGEHEFTFYLGASSTPSIAVAAASPSVINATLTIGSDHLSSSRYYIENTTAGTNSGWQAGTTWSSTGLSCGTSYSFKVKAKNTFGYETSFSTPVSVTTAACAGGSLPPATPPVLPNPVSGGAVVINKGDAKTLSANVMVYLKAQGATQVALSNTPDFSNATYQPFVSQINWKLSPGIGEKTVYVRFSSASGGTIEAKDDITLLENSPSVSETAPCVLMGNLTYKAPGVSAVAFITEYCTKRYFIDEKSYLSFFPSWSLVRKTQSDVLLAIPDHPLGLISLRPGPNATIVFTKNLMVGSKNIDVKNLQSILAKSGFFPSDMITGFYGSITKNSVIEWQKKNNLPATGILDAPTRSKLNLMILNGQVTW